MLYHIPHLCTNRAQPNKTFNPLFLLNFLKAPVRRRHSTFPPCRRKRVAGGNAVSAMVGLLMFGLLSNAVHAEQTAKQQIDQAIEQYWSKIVAAESKTEGWRASRFSHSSVEVEGHSETLPSCSQRVKATTDGGASLAGRHRLEITCPDQPGWTVKVNSKVDVFLLAVFANQLIERGHTITAEQVELKELQVGRATRGFFDNIDDAVGMGAKRRIRPDQLITSRLLTMPFLVRRGQQVEISARKDGIAATTLGEALEDGQEGDVIRVRNLSSAKVIKAQVLDEGAVSSTY